mmetsp:Transcript_14801/g.26611  ORF Transcript_14801/g.26611 Transcript_14801/m.26611 type:complete len:235 (+) Transcript_14801:1570-2274(+)
MVLPLVHLGVVVCVRGGFERRGHKRLEISDANRLVLLGLPGQIRVHIVRILAFLQRYRDDARPTRCWRRPKRRRGGRAFGPGGLAGRRVRPAVAEGGHERSLKLMPVLSTQVIHPNVVVQHAIVGSHATIDVHSGAHDHSGVKPPAHWRDGRRVRGGGRLGRLRREHVRVVPEREDVRPPTDRGFDSDVRERLGKVLERRRRLAFGRRVEFLDVCGLEGRDHVAQNQRNGRKPP